MKGEQINLVAFSETDYRLFTHKRAIRTPDGWKFIYTLETNKKELYNLNVDPQEQRNLVEIEQKKAYELEQELLQWLKSMQTDINFYKDIKETIIKEY
jgi:arylsulfatase A-like enzyme